MKILKNNKLSVLREERLIFWGAVILFVAVNIATLKDGHNWGDDFAQYIINAKNIVTHKPYSEGIILENTVTYPPGFPLLIAPFVKWFGVNLKILKAPNIFWWFLFANFWPKALELAGKAFSLWPKASTPWPKASELTSSQMLGLA